MPPSLSLNQERVLALFNTRESITTKVVEDELGLPRPTAKQTLNRLIDLKVIEQRGQGRGAYYLQMQKSTIFDSEGKQLVSVYQGIDSFENMFKQLARQLQKGDFYWSFAFKDEYKSKEVAQMLTAFHQQLTMSGVDDRSIVHASVRELVSSHYISVPKLKLRFTDRDLPVGLIIVRNAVISLVWSPQPLAIVVKAPEIYKRYYDFFLGAWQQAKK